MTAYPIWGEKDTYLADAQAAMKQVAADVDADTTNVWKSIDVVIAELHKLRNAASSEHVRRHDALMASSAALLADSREGVAQ